jgi:hypothetical protein
MKERGSHDAASQARAWHPLSGKVASILCPEATVHPVREGGEGKIGRSYSPSQGNTSTGSWGLVHLTEDEGDLGLAIELNDRSLLHFVVQIVALTGTLTNTCEDRVTTVGFGNVVLCAVSNFAAMGCSV